MPQGKNRPAASVLGKSTEVTRLRVRGAHPCTLTNPERRRWRALRRSPGYTPNRERAPWGDVPEEQRLDWCRALLDFPTFFPGPAWMGFAARTIREDRVSDAVPQWAWQADDFNRIGFTAADWYVLRLCVDRRLGEAARP